METSPSERRPPTGEAVAAIVAVLTLERADVTIPPRRAPLDRWRSEARWWSSPLEDDDGPQR